MAPVSRIAGRALATLLPDVRTLPGPVYAALADALTALVLDGRVAPETRLPSERELATALQVSRATITAAYDSLRAKGFLDSRTGSGSYVTVPRGAQPRTSAARWSLATGDVIDLSIATLPAPGDRLSLAVAAAAGEIATYATGDGYQPAGLARLREAVAARFVDRGVPTRPDQILITNGALHGLDLVLRLLASPGDRALTELPTYPGALDAIRAAGGRIVPVPMAERGGWQVDQLRSTLRQTAPRLAFLTPDYHNPTGVLVDESDRRAVYRAARDVGTTVIVDESFAELGFGGRAAPSAAIDGNVITLGSLSKPVWGGLRIGWVRASPDLVGRLAAVRATIDMAGPVLDQLVASRFVEDLDDILAERVAEIVPRRDALMAALRTELPQWRFIVPQGGLSLWAELDAPLSTPLSLLAGQAGVIVVPGSRFGVDGTLERFLRIPFSLPSGRLVEGVRRLADAWTAIDRTNPTARQLVVA
jgi:DNA-binding transcriptional MocR family regulator